MDENESTNYFGRVLYVNSTDMTTLDGYLKKGPDENELRTQLSEEPEKKSDETEREEYREKKKVLVNSNPLPKEALTYELEKYEKKAMLIFNHMEVDGYDLPRLGTEKDEEELIRTFGNFGFEITVKPDLTKGEVLDALKEYLSQDFSDYGCVAVVVLSHGEEQGYIRARDLPYSELEIVNKLQVNYNPSLITKPRLLIVQACRGTEERIGMTVGVEYCMQLDGQVKPYTLPVESDMLILHSSYIGKPSLRHILEGSWLIQSLCSKINELSSSLDFENIVTEVRREVAIFRNHREMNRRTGKIEINKQMPVSTSTLTRKLYLKEFGESLLVNDASAQPKTLSTDVSVPDCIGPTRSRSKSPMPANHVCECSLQHFEYIRRCLRLYLSNYPDDGQATNYLQVAESFHDSEKFGEAKKRMCQVISMFLKDKERAKPHFQYMFFNEN